jgi:hypothetical protein
MTTASVPEAMSAMSKAGFPEDSLGIEVHLGALPARDHQCTLQHGTC